GARRRTLAQGRVSGLRGGASRGCGADERLHEVARQAPPRRRGGRGVMPVDWERNRRPYESVLDVSGRTPLVRLRRAVDGRATAILAKLEMLSPSGSVKDRILPAMVRAAEGRGELRPGMAIVEGATGNTGIATAMTG